MTSPPINIDGTDITGATIDGQDVEQITIDGQDVLSAIPDSALLHFPYGERSNSTLVEVIEGADGTANGLTNVSGDWFDGFAESGDGTDDYADLTNLSAVNYGANLTDGYAIAVTIQTTTTNDVRFGIDDSNGTRVFGGLNELGNSGDLRFRHGDDDGNDDAVTASNTGFNDGNKHRIVLDAATQGISASNMRIWMDGAELSTSVTFEQGFSNTSNFAYSFLTHAINDEGSVVENHDAIYDNPIFYGSGFTESDVTADYDLQPWS